MSLCGPLPPNPFLALSSLPLAAPHRPATLYPSLVALPVWLGRFDVLQTLGDRNGAGGARGGASHRVVREAVGSTGCVNAMAWEEGGQERLATAGDDTKICIWLPGADAPPRIAGSNAVVSPWPGFGLSETIATGHRANIFSVDWAPSMETRLFSCAGDAQVRVFDLSLATNSRLASTTVTPSRESLHRPWTHHEDGTACTRVFRCHTDRVKRIATEASPDMFLTCAEDGTVRQHDLRTHHVCRKNRFDESDEAACPPPLASYRDLSLYSLTISKLRPHLFVVAGSSPFAYLHDRRMLRAPMQRDWHLPSSLLSPSSSSDLTQCVRRFGLPSATDARAHIVAAKLSPDRPRDLLVSYSGKGVYLFDTDGETFVCEKPPQKDGRGVRLFDHGVGHYLGSLSDEEADREARARAPEVEELRAEGGLVGSLSDDEAEAAVEAGGLDAPGMPTARPAPARPKRERDEPAHAGEAELPHASTSAAAAAVADVPPKRVREEVEQDSAAGEETAPGPLAEEAADAGMADVSEGEGGGHEEDDAGDDETEEDEGMVEGSGDGGSEDEEELEASEGPLSHQPRYRTDVPMVAPRKHYTGHANTQTVKDVNFLTRELVISGSDDGNFFVWDRETAQIKGIFKGDNDVVNVMQPHPRLPLVAISGIDETPRLFGPTSDAAAAARANLVGDAERIKRRNESGETARSTRWGTGGISRDDLLQLLFVRGAAAVGSDEEGEEGEEGEGGAAPRPRRAVRIVMGGGAGEEDGEQAVECVVS